MAASEDKLVNAIKKLMCTKNLDSLSVDEICKEAHVSRAAFYKRFKDKYDLAYYVFDLEVGRPVFSGSTDVHSFHARYRIFFEKIKADAVFYKNLIRARRGPESFQQHMTKLFLNNHINLAGKVNLTNEMILQLRMCSSGGYCLLEEWVLGGMKENIDTLLEIYYNAIPENLKSVFWGQERAKKQN